MFVCLKGVIDYFKFIINFLLCSSIAMTKTSLNYGKDSQLTSWKTIEEDMSCMYRCISTMLGQNFYKIYVSTS